MFSAVFFDTADNFHPFECNGPGKCVHCDAQTTDKHDPNNCALCGTEKETTEVNQQTTTEGNTETKIFPGHIDRYRDLRKLREEQEQKTSGTDDQSEYAALCIAEELAGLSYILDGIRYSTRK